MNSRIKEPKCRIFEKEIKYGSGVRDVFESVADTSCCMILNTQYRIKPYIR